ncbi:DUF4062 domain-containing protein [Tunturiibacter psychrotolerans]|uniref:DUF4062 domain-containing protein n=1 Tax=Tunturiibacter psychrotolerans TaxID=3069686 RepID=UPI003D1AD3AF
MERRYQVFVSSTYEDLREERHEVIQALLELDCMPSGMELFPATNDDQWTLIKRVIDDCDYYIVVIAGRYGSVGSGGKSYTQMEYEYAVETNKPIIAFLHNAPDSIQSGKCEKTELGKKALEDFRTMARMKTVRFYSSPSDLGSVVSRSLVKLIKSNPASGWVKADVATGELTSAEISRLREENRALRDKLSQQPQGPPAGSEKFAQGKEILEVAFDVSFKDRSHDNYTGTQIARLSWNDLATYGLAAVDAEETESAVEQAVARAATRQIKGSLGEQHPGLYDLEIKTVPEDIRTVLIQLQALGFIARSANKKLGERTWTLTPYGQTKLVELYAVKRRPSKKIKVQDSEEVQKA